MSHGFMLEYLSSAGSAIWEILETSGGRDSWRKWAAVDKPLKVVPSPGSYPVLLPGLPRREQALCYALLLPQTKWLPSPPRHD